MICNRDDTEEGSEQGKVSTEKKGKRGMGLFFLPIAFAVPILTVAAAGIIRFGPKILKLLNILIKAVVRV